VGAVDICYSLLDFGLLLVCWWLLLGLQRLQRSIAWLLLKLAD